MDKRISHESVKSAWGRGLVSYQEALKRVDIKPLDVVWRFGTWVVTGYGLECISNYYPIEAKRLWQTDEHYPWTRHMEEKLWVNMPDFLAAFEYAREYHKAKRKFSLDAAGVTG